MLNRRAFLKTGLTTGAAIPLTSTLNALAPASPLAGEVAAAIPGRSAVKLATLPARLPAVDLATEPWQQRIRRVAQSNMTEHDPAVMNVEEWADYWHSAQADIVFVSVTGILAFYPSKVKFHRHGKFLNGRDFFGECVAAAKKRGMRVVARMSPDLNWGDALEAHPEWFMRNRDGSPQTDADEPLLFKTCMFSSYMDDYVPAIMREVSALYDVDCFYTNGWPQIGAMPDCHCAICSKLPAPNTVAYWHAYDDRVFELWQKYDAIAKEKKPDSFFFANPRRQCPRRPQSRPPGQDCRVVPGRQPGPHQRRPSHLGMQPAGSRVQRHHGRQIRHQRDGCILHRRGGVAQRVEESRRSQDVDVRDVRLRHGPLLPLRRLRGGPGRGPTLAEDRRGLLPLDCAARRAPQDPSLHR
jgi:hypothetical protein